MNFTKNNTKKILPYLIIFALLVNITLFSIPQKSSAQIPTTVTSIADPNYLFWMQKQHIVNGAEIETSVQSTALTFWEKVLKYVQESLLKDMARSLALSAINKITTATVEWINSGFDGNPSYIADIGKFLTGTDGVVDQTIGNFIQNNSALNFLCSPFQLQVKLALQLNIPAFKKKIGCTFTQVSENVENAVDGASVILDINGNPISITKKTTRENWDEWLKTTLQPQNNPIGAFSIANLELDSAILTAKDSKKTEILSGNGSLSFKRCYDTYYDNVSNTQLSIKSEEYTEGGTRPEPPISNSGLTATAHCAVKTPGATISGMLIQNSTSDARIAEMQSALGDGLDSIMNALFNKLINTVSDKLRCGVLRGNCDSDSIQEYNNSLAGVNTQIINNYNNAVDGINTGSLTDITQYFNYDITSTTSSSTLLIADPYNPYATSTDEENTTNNTYTAYVPYSTTSILTYDTSLWQNSQNYTDWSSDSTSLAKKNANALIKALLKSENTYQNSYKTAQSVLTEAKTAFASSSACNLSYGRTDTLLRSLLIRANVITNIDGTNNSDRSIASIPWNLQVIKAAIADSEANVKLLNEASSNVGSAASSTAVVEAMTPVNSTSFNTDPQATMLENIKTWLRGVQNMYSSKLCPIDLTTALQITNSTSTSSY